MIEIIESHESIKVQNLAMISLHEHFPKDKLDQIVRIWINHPTPSLRDFVEKIVGTNGIPKPIASAALVMLDEYEKLEQTDPDFQQLDIFLKDLDPLL